MLLSNSHLHWGDRHTYFEVQLTAPGVTSYGAVWVGFPVLRQCFTEDLGWTQTTNGPNLATLYRLSLTDGGYELDGSTQPFAVERQVLNVLREDGTVGAEPLTIRRCAHGPVVAEEHGEIGGHRVPTDPGRPLTTPRGFAAPERAVAALDAAAEDLEREYGTLHVRWGDVVRLRRGSLDLPGNGAPGEMGAIRTSGLGPFAYGKAQIVSGDTFYAVVEFSDPVRGEALIGYGNWSRAGSKHVSDQLTLQGSSAQRPILRSSSYSTRAAPQRDGEPGSSRARNSASVSQRPARDGVPDLLERLERQVHPRRAVHSPARRAARPRRSRRPPRGRARLHPGSDGARPGRPTRNPMARRYSVFSPAPRGWCECSTSWTI